MNDIRAETCDKCGDNYPQPYVLTPDVLAVLCEFCQDQVEDYDTLDLDCARKMYLGECDEGCFHKLKGAVESANHRRRGRPRLPRGKLRSRKVEVGLTQRQWSEWTKTAADEYLSVQEWLRKLGDAAVVESRKDNDAR